MSCAVVALFALSACQAQPVAGPVPVPATSVWFVGDSVAHGVSMHMPSQPFRGARGGAGFTHGALNDVTTNTLALLDEHGVTPELMLVMAGVNDLSRGLVTPQDVVTGMVAFEGAMAERGIPVRWVLEPRWSITQLDTVNAWLLANRPDAIDCRAFAGPATIDTVHPVSYTGIARCVDEALAAAS